MTTVHDIAIVGAGIAGASLAAECLAIDPSLAVLVLEAEERPGYHSTGRSAAFWEATYGGPLIAPLTLASEAFLREGGFLRRRGALHIARAEDRPALDRFVARFAETPIPVERVGRAALAAAVPGLRADWVDGAHQPDCADIDVAGLHAHYLAAGRRAGARLETGARLAAARWDGARWSMETEDGRAFAALRLVDAAGAWADAVAALAGVASLGVAPHLRTVVQLRTDPAPPADLPLVLAIDESFYFKPEAGRLWLSPHDETPNEPRDAAPEELAVAEAIDRFERVVDWRVEAVERRWAGPQKLRARPAAGDRPRPGAAVLLLVRRAGRLGHPDLPRDGAAGRPAVAGARSRRDDARHRRGSLRSTAVAMIGPYRSRNVSRETFRHIG